MTCKKCSVFCPMEECKRRDPKGLYSKAAAGTVSAVTGFDSPYQPPSKPALRLDSSKLTVDEEVDAVLTLLAANGVLPAQAGKNFVALNGAVVAALGG